MIFRGWPSALIILIGDIVVLFGSLWLALVLRHQAWPTADLWLKLFVPFAIIFGLWLIILFIYDLYNLRLIIFQSVLGHQLIKAQLVNMAIAVGFFYFIPYFAVTPRTILFIFLILSFLALLVWRYFWGRLYLASQPGKIIFTCQGEAIKELASVLNQWANYQVEICQPEDLPAATEELVVIDTNQSSTNQLYSQLLGGTRFINAHNLYEEIFGRIPLSLVSERWLLDNISNHTKPVYDLVKRLMDLVSALILGVVSLIIYPIIITAIYLEDGRPIFLTQWRVGRFSRHFRLFKFRTMKDGQVTKVGQFLRKTRLDELPQLWNVLRGDLSLIGPRPELPDYVAEYRRVIPYYDLRHLITPGLSGWAQIYHDNHPHFTWSAEPTKDKLSYDLYYLKHRSLWLDLKIMLKTIRIILSRQGR